MTIYHPSDESTIPDITSLRSIMRTQGCLRAGMGIPLTLVLLFVWKGAHGDAPTLLYAGLVTYYIYSILTWATPRIVPGHILAPMLYFTAVADAAFMICWLPVAEEVPGVIVGLALFTGLGYGLRTGSKKVMFVNQGTMAAGYLGLLLLFPDVIQHPLRAISYVVPFFLVPLYVGALLDQLHAARRRAEIAATTDSLTGAKNRRSFDETIEIEWGRCRRTHSPLSIVMLDVDFFKKYNDHYGHPAGDLILKAVGGALRASIHRPGDGAFRIGGEEFALLLPDTGPVGASTIASHLLEQVRLLSLDHVHGINGKLSISVGVASTDATSASSAELIQSADSLLYQAKSEGRNRMVTQHPSPSIPAGLKSGENAQVVL